jgi:hypothetical protein
MTDAIHPFASPDDLQSLENVLSDTPTSKHTRRWLLQRAAAGAAVGAVGLGPATAAFGSLDRTAVDSIQTVVTTAATAEALAVTVLTASVKVAKGTPIEPFLPVLQAANTSEYDHFVALGTLGGKPMTTRFWIPDAALGKNNINLFKTLEIAETLFINAYLIGITAGTTAKLKPSIIRYMAEILGVEAEHRALARYARSQVETEKVQVPNNKGFETYTITSMGGIVSALEGAGFGFGKQGASPGQFADFPGDPRKNGSGSAILANGPS